MELRGRERQGTVSTPPTHIDQVEIEARSNGLTLTPHALAAGNKGIAGANFSTQDRNRAQAKEQIDT